LVNDDPKSRNTIETILRQNDYTVLSADTIKAANDPAKSNQIDLIVLGLEPKDNTGQINLQYSREVSPDSPVIILTDKGNISNAVEAIRQGAYDYIARPFKNEELLILVERALENKYMIEELNSLREEIAWKYGFDSIIGLTPAMEQLKHLASRVAGTDIAVLISGESGTGKEVLAKAIHYHSQRRKQKFITIDCASIPENLLESELFGNTENTYTPNQENRKGLFEEADKGTVFLAEVGDIPLPLQAKILKVLQGSEITPVGSSGKKKIDVRIIAATNRNLTGMIKEGSFLEDLYYRLNVLPIKIPSLGERKDDIPILADHFLRLENLKTDETSYTITPDAIEKLLIHHWPGNVRELENTIKRAIALSQNNRIQARDIIFINSGQTSTETDSPDNTEQSQTGTLEDSLKQRIESTLSANDWNFTKTASQLGIGRTTLWRKIRKFNIEKKEKLQIG